MDIRVEFSEQLRDIDDEMRSIVDERGDGAKPLYEMLAYHLGIDSPDRPRGKRMRPLLGLLAYQSLSDGYETALPGAAAVELGHNFSLVHDDIEDGDLERHHRPTLWALWGVPLAINAGDALFALSRLALYRLLDRGVSETRLLKLMRIYDETCIALCEGQFLDIEFERRADVTVAEYLEMIGKKTAALVGASVQAGAILATDDDVVVEAYRRFGYQLGLAFQMADDVKGTFWASERSGKPEAGDVKRRKKSLPLVWALEHADEPDRSRLRAIYADPLAGGEGALAPMSPDEVDEVLAILERCGARENALAEVRQHRDAALSGIAALPVPQDRRDELAALVLSLIAA